jgi:peptidyl-prolyl cis-trans isomerase C
MVNEELLHQQAKRSGYEKNDAFKNQVKVFEKQFEDAKKQALINLIVRDNIDSKIQISQEEVAAYYNNNPKQFEEFEQRRAKHILVKDKAEAQRLLNRIKQKKSSFDAVAKKYSQDPTAENGGDLGWFKKGDLVPEFEKAVFALRKNQLSQVVKTEFGYHIIQLTDTKTVAKRELKDVQQQIQQAIYNQKRNTALNEYLKTLKQNHKVTYTEAKPTEAPETK